MVALSLSQMDCFTGGQYNPDIVKICAFIGAGTGIFTIGAAIGWWNPAGWICDVALVVGAACDIYNIGAGIEYVSEKI